MLEKYVWCGSSILNGNVQLIALHNSIRCITILGCRWCHVFYSPFWFIRRLQEFHFYKEFSGRFVFTLKLFLFYLSCESCRTSRFFSPLYFCSTSVSVYVLSFFTMKGSFIITEKVTINFTSSSISCTNFNIKNAQNQGITTTIIKFGLVVNKSSCK